MPHGSCDLREVLMALVFPGVGWTSTVFQGVSIMPAVTRDSSLIDFWEFECLGVSSLFVWLSGWLVLKTCAS